MTTPRDNTPSTDTRCCQKCVRLDMGPGTPPDVDCYVVCNDASCKCHTEPKEWETRFKEMWDDPLFGGIAKGEAVAFITETIAKEVEKERERIFQAIKAEARWHWQSRLTEMADWFDSLRPHKLK